METFLLVWINEKQVADDCVSEAIICEKAKHFFEELYALGTKGWFTGFRKRNGSVVMHGEAAEQHSEKFKKIFEEGAFFRIRCLTATKLVFSGRECHAKHTSRRRPSCLAISRRRTGLHCSFVLMLRRNARSNHCSCTIRTTPELLKTLGKTAWEFCGVPTTRLGWPGAFSQTGWLSCLAPLSVTTLGRRIFHWRFFWSWTTLQPTLLIWWMNYQGSSVSSRSTSCHRIRRLSSSLWSARWWQFFLKKKRTLY